MSRPPRAFAHSGGFHFRTPLLAFDAFLALGGTDRSAARARLRELVESPALRDAIFVASPDLDEALAVWLADPESDRGQRVERALMKYVSRAAGRATPFGLFAGTSVGRIGDATDLALESRGSSIRHSRLDMDYLFALTGTLTSDPARRGGFTLVPNSSLYDTAGHIRYVEARLSGEERTYHLVAVEASDALAATIARASSGATAADLAAALVRDDISQDEADEFITDLIDSQILVPDLGLIVTGGEPTRSLATQLAVSETTRDVAEALASAETALAAIDAEGLGAAPSRYRAIAESLAGLPAKPEMKRLIQVDLVKQSPHAVLGEAVLDELTRAADLVRHLMPQTMPSDLAAFKEAFRDRYEGGEVRLVDALDEESGIGFPPHQTDGSDASPLVKDLPAPDEPKTVLWGKREQWLIDRLGRALAAGEQEIVLSDKDVAALSQPSPHPLAAAFAVAARVAARSSEAIAQRRFRVRIDAVTGASGAVLLGRFCHADSNVRALVADHLRAEEALEPDAVFAEIVHLPEGRIGNILLRPLVREYEIAFLGESGAPAARRLPITDLMLSIRDDTLHLRSARLDRRVIPRLTAAHNFSLRSLGVYRFLCSLQQDGTSSGPGWHWGPLDTAPFLPRMTCGRLVLAPATWNLTTIDLDSLAGKTAADRFSHAQALRHARRLPRFIVVTEWDNNLPVDLDAALSVETFVHLVKGQERARIEEMFPPPDELCAYGPDGRYTHEVVVPFVRTSSQPGSNLVATRLERGVVASGFSRTSSAQATVVRRFPPGSEWLYGKVYTGLSTADRVLLDGVAPLAEAAIRSGAADRWFFIRYADPREHLRVRFQGDPERLRTEVLPKLLALGASELARGAAWKVQLDTYEREVERYGGPAGIEFAEQLFHADSDAAIEILRLLESGDAGNDERWRICLLGLDALLSDFDFDLEQKHAVVSRSRKGYGLEQREDAALRHALGDRHRAVAREIAPLLAVQPNDDHPLAPGVAVLHERSRRLAPIVAELQARERDGRLVPGLLALASSFMHMHAIRIFRGAAKRNELVLYELLSRGYVERSRRRPAEDSM